MLIFGWSICPFNFLIFQLGKFFYQKYIYYEKSDRFPWNGGNQCGSAPVIIRFFHLFVASLLGTPNALQIRIPNYELVFLVLHFQFMCVPTALAYLNKKKDFPFIFYLGTFQWKNIYMRLKILADIFNILLRWFHTLFIPISL